MSAFWTEDRIAVMAAGLRAGKLHGEIADEVGTTRAAVSQALRRLKQAGHPISRISTPSRAEIARRTFRAASAGPVEIRPHSPPVPEHQRVDRDPCWRCATRRDIGCSHTR